VYSIEVEAALTDHPAVREAAVFGIPDARWGEAVHAIVSMREDDPVTTQELIDHCRARIAGYKIPRTIDVQTTPLPKSGAGKLLKNVLREPFWQGQARRVH
jgi:long-chain acyl-CoA synthetase